MPTSILATGTSDADSADQVIAAGDVVNYGLKNGAAANKVLDGSLVLVMMKDDAGAYFQIDTMDVYKPVLQIVGPGTFLFRRRNGISCGVFSG